MTRKRHISAKPRKIYARRNRFEELFRDPRRLGAGNSEARLHNTGPLSDTGSVNNAEDGNVYHSQNDPEQTMDNNGDEINGHIESRGEHCTHDTSPEQPTDIQFFMVMNTHPERVATTAPGEEGSFEEREMETVSDTANKHQSDRRSDKWKAVLCSSHTMYAITMVTGTVKFTVDQYNSCRRIVNFSGKYTWGKGMPSYSKMRDTIFPTLKEKVFIPAFTRELPVDMNKAGAHIQFSRRDSEQTETLVPVKIVNISSWARRDVSTMSFFNSEDTDHQAEPLLCHREIENAPMVRCRQHSLHASNLVTESFDAACVRYCARRPHVELHIRGASSTDIQHFEEGDFQPKREGTEIILIARLQEGRLCQDDHDFFRAGDIIAVASPLSPNPTVTHRKMMHLVHRILKREGENHVFVTLTEPGSQSMVSIHRCTDIRELSSEKESNDRTANPQQCEHYSPMRGRLEDGRRYVVYRVLLFCDDFKQRMGREGSAGGCYMLPIGLPLHLRRGKNAVRVLSLAPPGVSTNDIVKELIPDIVSGTTVGFPGYTEDGEAVTIFTDVIGFQADYKAVKEAGDTTGPTGLAPCHLCSFLKGDGSGCASSCAYTTIINSRHPSFARDRQRMDAVRANVESGKELQQVGLRAMSEMDVQQLPLHKLSRALEQARSRVPKTNAGVPVVPAFIDPYRSAFVAPDHLFGGLAEDILVAHFSACTTHQRKVFELLTRDMLERNAITAEDKYFNHQKLHMLTMPMSSVFNALMVSAWAFRYTRLVNTMGFIHVTDLSPDPLPTRLVKSLQTLLSTTNFFPVWQVDGKSAVRAYNADGGKEHLSKMNSLASSYVSLVNEACVSDELFKKKLDKPNVHRLLELYAHTIPAFGHVVHAQELMFESAHQPLKRALGVYKHRKSQISAMDAVIADDWSKRLGDYCLNHIEDTDTMTSEQLRNLYKLALGMEKCQGLTQDEDNMIRQCFIDPVITELRSCGTYSTSPIRSERRTWRPSNRKRIPTALDLEEGTRQYTKKAIEMLSMLRLRTDTSVSFKLVDLQRETSGRIKHEKLKTGSFIQAVVHKSWTSANNSGTNNGAVLLSPEESCIIERAEDNFACSFWYVICFLEKNEEQASSSSSHVYGVVVPTQKVLEDFDNVFRVQTAGPCYVLPITSGIRRVFSIHMCHMEEVTGDRTCRVDIERRKVIHNFNALEGSAFALYGTREGFPPRNA